jgi:opacity protein-like surface antigen
MKRMVSGAALAALLLTPPPAQSGSLTLLVDGGLRTMSNSPDTEQAIFGSKKGLGGGLGLSYDHGSAWRFGLDVRRVSREGERAFAMDRATQAFRLGHPLTLTLVEGVASASYRFGEVGPVSPYLTLGGGFASFKESSDIAGLVEKESGAAALFEARLGLERQAGALRLAIEGGITMIPNAVGVGGISRVYEEKDLGGLFVVARIGFSRR